MLDDINDDIKCEKSQSVWFTAAAIEVCKICALARATVLAEIRQ
jgi:hypothetical protein